MNYSCFSIISYSVLIKGLICSCICSTENSEVCIGDITFLQYRPWISPWINAISNELDIINRVIASQLSGNCDVISNRLWRRQQNDNRASERRGDVQRWSFLSSFMDSLCRVRKKNNVCTLATNCFSSVILVFINTKNNPRVSAETGRHSSTYIILYFSADNQI